MRILVICTFYNLAFALLFIGAHYAFSSDLGEFIPPATEQYAPNAEIADVDAPRPSERMRATRSSPNRHHYSYYLSLD